MIRDRHLAAADAIERDFQRLAEIADERSPTGERHVVANA
jgi:hypothetical protein